MQVARKVESKFPQFKQRLLTLTELPPEQAQEPFLPLVAEDTLAIALRVRPQDLVGLRTILTIASVAAAIGLLLAWLILSSPGRMPGSLANEARALWTGDREFAIDLQRVRKTVMRASAVTVSAHLNNFTARKADLFVRYASSKEWKAMPMLQGPDNSEFVFEFPHLSEGAEFYVKAEGIRSSNSSVSVADIPRVRHIAVSYFYPSGKPVQAPARSAGSHGGDIIAPIGTVAKLDIETDRPMIPGELSLDPGDSVVLAPSGDNRASASLRVLRDGSYHVSVRYGGELVRISDQYEIEVPTANNSRPQPVGPIKDVRTGPVPVGYEKAVAAYYKRLSEVQDGTR
jgi:hypothetical protein